MLDIILGILTFAEILIGLGILIFLHEAGHFLMAKRNKVRVEAFSLGMGPILWRRIWGETEYRISAIPLGGYVKMAGENIGDERTGADYELSSKSAWARFQIFSAGAIMNLIIAFPIAILAFMAGRSLLAPEVSVPFRPESNAGILPGDRVIEVDGKPITSLEGYRKEVVRKGRDTTVDVKILRGTETLTKQVIVTESDRHGFRPPFLTIGGVKPGSPVALAGFRDHDEVLSINGKRQLFHIEMLDTFNALAGQEVTLSVRNRSEPKSEPRTVTFRMPERKIMVIPPDNRLREVAFDKVAPGSAAKDAGLLATDRIVKIDDKVISHWKNLTDAVEEKAGQEITIEYERDGKIQPPVKVRPSFNEVGKGMLGFQPRKTRKIVLVAEDSPYFGKLQSGDTLEVLNGEQGGGISVLDFAAGVKVAKEKFKPIEIKVSREGASGMIAHTINGTEMSAADLEAAGFVTKDGHLVIGPNMIEQRWTFSGAIKEGLNEPIDITILTFQLLGKLFKREESAANLSGPLGIFTVSYEKARTGIGDFLWLLMLITVNLGIFNLLPIPVLDGGHIALLVIEKIKGRALSPRFVERFQLIGVVFLLGLIVFVTFNDIGRFFR